MYACRVTCYLRIDSLAFSALAFAINSFPHGGGSDHKLLIFWGVAFHGFQQQKKEKKYNVFHNFDPYGLHCFQSYQFLTLDVRNLQHEGDIKSYDGCHTFHKHILHKFCVYVFISLRIPVGFSV